jgi:hypothetical protein
MRLRWFNRITRTQRLVGFCLTLYLLIGPIACITDCHEPPFFTIQDVMLSNGKTHQIIKPSGYVSWVPVNETDPLPYDSLLMKVHYSMEFYTQLINKGGFSAYARTCEDPGRAGSPGGIDTLYFIIQQHYNNYYTVNDTINSMVMVNGFYPSLEDFNDRFVTLEDFILTNNMIVRNHEFYIKLMEPPSQEGTFTFKLIFRLNNGSTFESITEPINLLP